MKRSFLGEGDEFCEPASKCGHMSCQDGQDPESESSNFDSGSESEQDSETVTTGDDFQASPAFATPTSSLINQLPDAALVKIFRLCRVETLLRSIRLVCKKWLNLCRDREVWTEQDVYGTPEMTDPILRDLLRYAPCSSVDLTNSHLVTTSGLCKALVHGQSVKTLSLSKGSIEIGKDVVTAIVEHCPSFVDFRGSCVCGSEDVDLEYRSLDGKLYPSPINTLLELLTNLTNLKRLDFRDCETYFEDEQLIRVIKACPQLRELALDLHNTKLWDPTFHALPYRLTHLTILGPTQNPPVHTETISSDGVAAIAKLSHLKVLKLYHFQDSDAVTAENLSKILGNCRHLETLHLCDVGFNDEMARCVATSGKSLKRLAFNSYSLTKRGLYQVFMNCLNLISLKLQDPRLTVLSFLTLVSFQQRKGCLHSLKIYYAKLIPLTLIRFVQFHLPPIRIRKRTFVRHLQPY